ncbi:hypothetical protein E4U54_006761 [Claviceps lovelessii]|nr:hypothetical protein E4U54_006761 [Claviceps lovelessii]
MALPPDGAQMSESGSVKSGSLLSYLTCSNKDATTCQSWPLRRAEPPSRGMSSETRSRVQSPALQGEIEYQINSRVFELRRGSPDGQHGLLGLRNVLVGKDYFSH